MKNRNARSLLISLLSLILLLDGCASAKRPPLTQERLMEMRTESRDRGTEAAHIMFAKLLTRTKAQYDDYTSHQRPNPPVIDILIISGGGDWGAFGSGFLKGWKKIPAGDPLAMPEFTAVTGVSTGALIAPFAFLQDEASIDRVVNLYRNPKPDWVKQRGMLYFLPNNISFAEVPGLERELKSSVDADIIKRIAEAGADGRVLAVNTSNVDDGSPRVFDLVSEAKRATDSGDLDRFHNIMLASSGIPGAFPFRMIDNELYVDGGITSNIIYGGRLGEEDTIPAVWQKTYPNLTIPKLRFWVIFNNQIQPQPQVTPPNWPAVVQRALEMSTRAATLTAMRHLFAMAEISRLKRHCDVEVRIVSIPTSWSPPVPGIFIKETMNNLADLGEKMGADPSSWSDQPPPP
ncbi:MAG TPA: patatin-like phospholipase family protein [Tepidisphaeraceae bacterium]|jgi:hypothetical protein|nr:patatin-like phospholipase family protein [Tepidisphaeraceae bacterium]